MKLRFFISGKFNLTFYGVEITEKIWQNFQLQKGSVWQTRLSYLVYFLHASYMIFIYLFLKKFLYNFLLSNYIFLHLSFENDKFC